MDTRRFLVSGRVQGVGFRFFVRSAADRLGVSGWTRNMPDGCVECVARGEPDALRQFADELHRGPPLARVASVDAASHPAISETRFEIRP